MLNINKIVRLLSIDGYITIIKKVGYIDDDGQDFADLWYCGYVSLPQKHVLNTMEEYVYKLGVHGGITFSGSMELDNFNSWWIGFDCHHGGDSIKVQDLNYVIKELHDLVEQLQELDKNSQGGLY